MKRKGHANLDLEKFLANPTEKELLEQLEHFNCFELYCDDCPLRDLSRSPGTRCFGDWTLENPCYIKNNGRLANIGTGGWAINGEGLAKFYLLAIEILAKLEVKS